MEIISPTSLNRIIRISYSIIVKGLSLELTRVTSYMSSSFKTYATNEDTETYAVPNMSFGQSYK